MEVGIIFKIGAVGILVSVLEPCVKTQRAGRSGILTSLAGLVLVLILGTPLYLDLFETVKKLFAL